MGHRVRFFRASGNSSDSSRRMLAHERSSVSPIRPGLPAWRFFGIGLAFLPICQFARVAQAGCGAYVMVSGQHPSAHAQPVQSRPTADPIQTEIAINPLKSARGPSRISLARSNSRSVPGEKAPCSGPGCSRGEENSPSSAIVVHVLPRDLAFAGYPGSSLNEDDRIRSLSIGDSWREVRLAPDILRPPQ